MNSPSETLVSMAHEIGRQIPFWVQGGGGNVSIKDGEDLFIKASGTRLDQMAVDRGIAHVSLSTFVGEFRRLMSLPDGAEREASYSALLNSSNRTAASCARPSMETGFHALLPLRMVYHFHSLASVLMAQPEHRERASRVIAARGGKVAFVELTKPGVCLTEAVVAEPQADVHLLASHGVIVGGSDEGALARWREMESAFLEESGSEELKRFAGKTIEQIFALLATKEINFPWRSLFPDAAVFEAEILKTFGDGAGRVRLNRAEATRRRANGEWNFANLFEVAIASYLLQLGAPGLPDLSEQFMASLVSMPTEKFRKGHS